VRLEIDQRAGKLSLPHLGITKTEKIELKHKTDEQLSPVNSLESWDRARGGRDMERGTKSRRGEDGRNQGPYIYL